MMDRRLEVLEGLPWTPRDEGSSSGPKRLFKFCLLGVLLPIVALCVPLYMRFQALRPHTFLLSPSDMRLLNQESKVSTVWCEGQELRTNGSFNAYLLPTRPRLRRQKRRMAMKREMMLRDDVKEFWGFYLLRGSQVRLRVCARREGASFIVVKGLGDARRCSYLGELDSMEDSDESSEEFELTEDVMNIANSTDGDFLQRFAALSNVSRQAIVLNLLRSLGGREDRKSDQKIVSDPEGEVYDLIKRGRFDQNNANDESKGEVASSWSSSEEALANCEGLIFNVALDADRNCSSKEPEPEVVAAVTLDVSHTGFYYFIFANENEIADNFVRAHFDMSKTFFDVSSQMENCTNVTSCVLPLDFWSEQHLVLEIPEVESSDPCREESLIKGYSSVTDCQGVVIAESVCKPRKPVFTAFVLLVPVLILFFAYV